MFRTTMNALTKSPAWIGASAPLTDLLNRDKVLGKRREVAHAQLDTVRVAVAREKLVAPGLRRLDPQFVQGHPLARVICVAG